jgi:hypothetical protein
MAVPRKRARGGLSPAYLRGLASLPAEIFDEVMRYVLGVSTPRLKWSWYVRQPYPRDRDMPYMFRLRNTVMLDRFTSEHGLYRYGT